jgi:hypothetical protein
MDKCLLGLHLKSLLYQGNVEDLKVFEGHGIYLCRYNSNDDAWQTLECGCLNIGCFTVTVVGRVSDECLLKGDIIKHIPDKCAVGIKRFKD